MAIVSLTIYPQVYCWKKNTLDSIVNGSPVDSYGDWVGIIGEKFARYELNPMNMPPDARGIEVAVNASYSTQMSLGLTMEHMIQWMGITTISEYSHYQNGLIDIPFLKLIETQEIKGTNIYTIPYLSSDSSDVETINIALRVRYVAIAVYKDETTNETRSVPFPSSNENPYLTVLNAHKTFDILLDGNQTNQISLIDYEGNQITPDISGSYTVNVLPYYVISRLYGYGQNNRVKMDGWELNIIDDYSGGLEGAIESLSDLPTQIKEIISSLCTSIINDWSLVDTNNNIIADSGNKFINPANAYVQHKVNMVSNWNVDSLGVEERILNMWAMNQFTNEMRIVTNAPGIHIIESPIEDYAQFMTPSALFFDTMTYYEKLKVKLFTIPDNPITNVQRKVYAVFWYKKNNVWYHSSQHLISNVSGVNGVIPNKDGGVTYIDKIGSFGISNLNEDIDVNTPIFGNLYIEYDCKINGTQTTIEGNTIPFGFNLRQIQSTINSASVKVRGSSIEAISLQLKFNSNLNGQNYSDYLSFLMKSNSISLHYSDPSLADSWLNISPITLSSPQITNNNTTYTFTLQDINDNAGTKTYDGTHEIRVALYDLNDQQKEISGTIKIEIPGDLRIETGTSVEFDPTSEFELRGIVSQ